MLKSPGQPVAAGASARKRGPFGPRADALGYLRRVAEPRSVVRVAAVLGLRPNTARYHLDALVRAGLVNRAPELPTRRGRPRVLYVAAEFDSPGAGALASYYALADTLIHQLVALRVDPSAAAEAAGFTWGCALTAQQTTPRGLPRLLDVLIDLGHRPTLVEAPAAVIQLQPCPFGDVLAATGDAVCRLHLGLMRGLVSDDPDLDVVSLRRRAAPGRCTARLSGPAPLGGESAGESRSDRGQPTETSQ